MITTYEDGGRVYLELHAQRAPVGGYRDELTADEYNARVEDAIEDFQNENKIIVYTLGRSGRHICIEDTPVNRRRYASLRRKAIAAVTALWASMRQSGA